VPSARNQSPEKMSYVAPTGMSYAAGAVIIVVGILVPLTVMVSALDRKLMIFLEAFSLGYTWKEDQGELLR
jgi:hypothetical protein